MAKSCTNCPGATDHDTAHCPLRGINYGALDPAQRLELARTGKHPEQAEGAQGEREAKPGLFCRDCGERLAVRGVCSIYCPKCVYDGLDDRAKRTISRENVEAVLAAVSRAALAQPSPKCATCNDSGQIVVSGPHYCGEFQPPEYETEPCDMCALPSPAPELDDQAFDRNAERLTFQAFGPGSINPNATSIDDLFLDEASAPDQSEQPLDMVELEKQEPVALANRGHHAFWVKWTDAAAGLYGPGIKLYANPVAQAGQVPEKWQPMGTAPRDGSLIRLLVDFEDMSIDDGDGPFATIGQNNLDNDGEDRWQVVGWCWEHDHFTDGKGTPVGWLPMLAAAPKPAKGD